MPEATRFDCLFVGGGLQNALIAMALLEHRPQARFAIIEQESQVHVKLWWSTRHIFPCQAPFPAELMLRNHVSLPSSTAAK
jgi:hypothetical protein